MFFIAILFIQSNQFVSAYYLNPPLPMAASDVLPKYKGKSFVTSYHSVYPTIFTKQWAVPNWNGIITPENINLSQYVWLKNKNYMTGQRKYSNPDYYLHLYRKGAPSIDIRMKETFKIVEQGNNYEIYRLR